MPEPIPDPRTQIPDILATDADGDLWKLWLSQCMLVLPHRGEMRAEIGYQAFPVRSVVDGVAQLRNGEPIGATDTLTLADMPPELAAANAAWLHSVAATRAAGRFPHLAPKTPEENQ
jgi:hypothetical protein